MRGHTTAIRVLLTAGADVTFRTVDEGKSGLDLVAEEGHVDTARVIIEHGGDVDAVGTDGSSPLHRAVFSNVGSAEMVAFFCLKGAAVDAVNDSGSTPIILAAMRGNGAVTQALYWLPERTSLFAKICWTCRRSNGLLAWGMQTP